MYIPKKLLKFLFIDTALCNKMIKEQKIINTETNEIEFHIIPCKNKRGVEGIYDCIKKKFYSKKVIENAIKNSTLVSKEKINNYKELEYIENSFPISIP